MSDSTILLPCQSCARLPALPLLKPERTAWCGTYEICAAYMVDVILIDVEPNDRPLHPRLSGLRNDLVGVNPRNFGMIDFLTLQVMLAAHPAYAMLSGQERMLTTLTHELGHFVAWCSGFTGEQNTEALANWLTVVMRDSKQITAIAQTCWAIASRPWIADVK